MTEQQPDRENVIRLLAACEKIFTGQPAADVYNALVNLLGWTLVNSGEPEQMLMQTIKVLAQHTKTEVMEAEEEEEVTDARSSIATH